MKLAEITERIIECFEDNISEAKNIGSQTGILDIRNPQLTVNDFPALRITPKQLSPKQQDFFDTQEYEITYLLYYFNKAKDDWMDDMVSLNLLDNVLRFIKSNNWGVNSITPARNVIANTLSINKIGDHLVNGWQVEWQHTMQLASDNASIETPDNPKHLFFSSDRDDFGIAERYTEVNSNER
ncbi:hypothetical protein [Zooshikella sp. RANM57]|uniref:hypothetical protein n=1 Tax=Zooshikella sp. RANM57 TaxID=3425863 RepID=UPI003D6DBEBB